MSKKTVTHQRGGGHPLRIEGLQDDPIWDEAEQLIRQQLRVPPDSPVPGAFVLGAVVGLRGAGDQ